MPPDPVKTPPKASTPAAATPKLPPLYGLWYEQGGWLFESENTPRTEEEPRVLAMVVAKRGLNARVAVVPPNGGPPTEFYEPPAEAN